MCIVGELVVLQRKLQENVPCMYARINNLWCMLWKYQKFYWLLPEEEILHNPCPEYLMIILNVAQPKFVLVCVWWCIAGKEQHQ